MTLEIITHRSLDDCRHGFFTRRGGNSLGVYQGLNCGLGSLDERETVQENRALVAEAVGIGPENLRGVYQIHSNKVIVQNETSPLSLERADGLVTKTKGLGLSILTADCAPILFCDPKNQVIGAAHSGWKGALSGISQNIVEAMEGLGADRAEIRAVIGPCISQINYEVGQEFVDVFYEKEPENMRFFANGAPGKYQFDLPGFCLNALSQLNIFSAQWTGHCTYADAERFYSFRRKTHLNEPDYGRLISTIRL